MRLGDIRNRNANREFDMASALDMQLSADKPMRDQVSQLWGIQNYYNKTAAYDPLETMQRSEYTPSSFIRDPQLVDEQTAAQMMAGRPREIRKATPEERMSAVVNLPMAKEIKQTGSTRELYDWLVNNGR